MARRSDRAAGMEAEEAPRPLLPWLGRACRQARKERNVVQVNAKELDVDVRLLWLHAFVLWLENEPVLDSDAQEEIRAALRRVANS